MIKFFFQQYGETKFIGISPETYERLRLHSWKIRTSLQQVANSVHKRFGNISEELIVLYLDELN